MARKWPRRRPTFGPNSSKFIAEVVARWQQRVKLEQDDLGRLGRRELDARIELKRQQLDDGRGIGRLCRGRPRQLAATQERGRRRARPGSTPRSIGSIAENARYAMQLRTGDGQSQVLPLEAIVRAYPANQLRRWGRLGVYVSRWREFLLDRAAREQRRGSLSGDLRHRGHDADDVAVGRAVRRVGGPLFARIRQGRPDASAPCGSRSTTWPACPASCSACSGWGCFATSSGPTSTDSFSGPRWPKPAARPSAPAACCGRR